MSKPSRFFSVFLLAVFCLFVAVAAEKSTAPQLIELAKNPGPALRDAITATFDPKTSKKNCLGWSRSRFFFATRAPGKTSATH